MKNIKIVKFIFPLMIFHLLQLPVFAEDPEVEKNTIEIVRSSVLKVYKTQDGDFKYIAYKVKWGESEVIISDPLAATNFQVGDVITYTVQYSTLPSKKSANLSFMIIPTPRDR